MLGGDVEEVAVGADAGVRDHDVEAAEALDGLGHEALELLRLAHVAGQGERARDALVAAAARGERDLRAEPGERLRSGGADAAARAGHERDPSLDCAHVLLPGLQWSECGCDGGTSSAGLRAKNPTGLSWKPAVVTGMIGQSSGRGTWWWPNVYQTTTSSPSIDAVGARPLGQARRRPGGRSGTRRPRSARRAR